MTNWRVWTWTNHNNIYIIIMILLLLYDDIIDYMGHDYLSSLDLDQLVACRGRSSHRHRASTSAFSLFFVPNIGPQLHIGHDYIGRLYTGP